MEIGSTPKFAVGPRSKSGGFDDVTVTVAEFAVAKDENRSANNLFFVRESHHVIEKKRTRHF